MFPAGEGAWPGDEGDRRSVREPPRLVADGSEHARDDADGTDWGDARCEPVGLDIGRSDPSRDDRYTEQEDPIDG